jgi:hypothetical protein
MVSAQNRDLNHIGFSSSFVVVRVVDLVGMPTYDALGEKRGVETAPFEVTPQCERYFCIFDPSFKSHLSQLDTIPFVCRENISQIDTCIFNIIFSNSVTT